MPTNKTEESEVVPDQRVLSDDDESDDTATEVGFVVEDDDDDSVIIGDDNEYGELLKTYTADADELPERVEVQFRSSIRSLKALRGGSFYGKPFSSLEEYAEDFPEDDEGGLVWNATIVPDRFVDTKTGGVLEGLNERDYDTEHREIKPRRPSLPVTKSDFFASLTRVPSGNKKDGGSYRYFFDGVLNGWPGLKQFELIKLDRKRKSDDFALPSHFLTGQRNWIRAWNTKKHGQKGIHPRDVVLKKKKKGSGYSSNNDDFDENDTTIYRARLRTAPWSSEAWSKDSRGFVFWFEALHPDGPRLTYGTDMINKVGENGNAKCTHVHMVSYRYAMSKEAMKDKLTYHTVVLLEWDHGKYCTVVEIGFLNGSSGANGRSSHYDDKLCETGTALYKAMHPEMIAPWLTTNSEIRCFDVPSKNLEEYKAHIHKYTGNTKEDRFLDPNFHFSHACRLTYNTRSHIAQYLVNYIRRDTTYNELVRNCQTFASDFACLLAGKRGIEPFHPVNRIEYTNRTYLFLYEPDMYRSNKRGGGSERSSRRG